MRAAAGFNVMGLCNMCVGRLDAWKVAELMYFFLTNSVHTCFSCLCLTLHWTHKQYSTEKFFHRTGLGKPSVTFYSTVPEFRCSLESRE